MTAVTTSNFILSVVALVCWLPSLIALFLNVRPLEWWPKLRLVSMYTNIFALVLSAVTISVCVGIIIEGGEAALMVCCALLLGACVLSVCGSFVAARFTFTSAKSKMKMMTRFANVGFNVGLAIVAALPPLAATLFIYDEDCCFNADSTI